MSPFDPRVASENTVLRPGTLLRVLLTVAFSVMGVLLIAQFAGAVTAPLVFVLLASVLALGLNPLVVRLETRLRVPRAVGAGLVIGGLVLLAFAFTALVVPLIVSQGVRFAGGVPEMLKALQSGALDAARKYPAIAPLLEGRSFADPTKLLGSGVLESGGLSAVTNLASFIGVMANAVVSGVLLTMLVLFLLMSPEPVIKGILGGIPPRSRPIVERTLIRVGSQLGSWLIGAVTVSISVGVIVGVGLRIVGFQDALLFGVIAAVTNLIPFVGPVIGMVPPVLMAVSGGHWSMALWAIGIALVAQQLDAYVFSPIIYGRTVKLHPASSIVAVLVFGSVLGLVGVFLAVPLVIILKALYEEVYLAVMQRPEASAESVAQVIAAGMTDERQETESSEELEAVQGSSSPPKPRPS